MSPRIAPALLIALLASVAAATEPDTQPQKNDNGMEFIILNVPARVFSTVDPSNSEGVRKPKPGVRYIENPFEKQYDVTEFLKQYGVAFPAGSLAVFNGSLIVRDTPANNRLIEQLFGRKAFSGNGGMVSIDLSAYECTIPAKNLLPWASLTSAALEDLPRNSMKLVDCISVVTKSGQRAVARHSAGPPGDTANAAAIQPGDSGSELEVEPVVGPSGDIIDTNMSYVLRGARGSDGTALPLMNFVTSFSVWDDYPLIVHVAPVPGQPEKHLVFVAWIKSGMFDGWKMPEPKFPLKTTAATKEPAPVKSASKMIVAVFRVPPGFLTSTQPREKQITALDFLKSNGVTFPPGSTAVFLPDHSDLIVIDTPENIELVDMIVSALNSTAPVVASVEFRAYGLTLPPGQTPAQALNLTFSDLRHMPAAAFSPMGCISLITKSGERAVACDTITPPDIEQKHDADTNNGKLFAFYPGETGVRMEIEPAISPDLKKVDVTFNYLFQAPENAGKLPSINLNASFTAQKGSPQIVQISPVENQKGKYIIVIASTKIVNPGGWNFQIPVFLPPPAASPPQPGGGASAMAPAHGVSSAEAKRTP